MRELIRSGALAANAVMPPTRTLASDIGVSRRLVLEAYEQLAAEGYLLAEPRRQTRVAPIGRGTPAPELELEQPQDYPLFDLRPRTSDLSLFPRRQWAKALARVLREAPDRLLGYPDPQGAPALRAALAAYLRRVRGVVADPARIVICAGFTEALALTTRVLQGEGRARIGLEDPGLIGQAEIISAAGGESHPTPVDEQGLRVTELERAEVDAVVVTPAHQFPTGVALPPERRSQLLQWARSGRLVIEDDYDAEFRYDRSAIGALQGLAPERVLYVGSASKTLAPALRLGWVVAPARLIEKLVQAKRLQDKGAPTLDQITLAELIHGGVYDRHLRLLRRLLKRRREVLMDELDRVIPELQITGAAAGLHVMGTLPSNISMPKLLANATQLRLGLAPISRYSLRKPANPRQLVIGYGNISDPAIPAVVQLLAQAISDH